MLAVPLTLVLVLVIVAYFFGGKQMIDNLFGAARNAAEGAVGNATRSAAAAMMKKDNWFYL